MPTSSHKVLYLKLKFLTQERKKKSHAEVAKIHGKKETFIQETVKKAKDMYDFTAAPSTRKAMLQGVASAQLGRKRY